MILSKAPCPDCAGSGRDTARAFGLCRACHGEGRRRMTAAEESARIERSLRCPCGLVEGACSGACGCYCLMGDGEC